MSDEHPQLLLMLTRHPPNKLQDGAVVAGTAPAKVLWISQRARWLPSNTSTAVRLSMRNEDPKILFFRLNDINLHYANNLSPTYVGKYSEQVMALNWGKRGPMFKPNVSSLVSHPGGYEVDLLGQGVDADAVFRELDAQYGRR